MSTEEAEQQFQTDPTERGTESMYKDRDRPFVNLYIEEMKDPFVKQGNFGKAHTE